MQKKLYRELASLVEAIGNCERSGNQIWKEKHTERLQKLTKEYMPSGSGFDHGTQLHIGNSTPNKLHFAVDFHHMNDNGFYCGWTEHTVIVTPSLAHEFEMRITGRNRNEVKELIHQTFDVCLLQEIDTTKV